jgi:phospholipase/carboxylesterase
MSLSLNTYKKEPLSGGAPKQVIVLLHGYGSNGQDLISLAPYWQRALPDAVFISPDAPEPCELAPTQGFQWFSLMSENEGGELQIKGPAKYLIGARAAKPALDDYLDEVLMEYGLANADLALVGFSQGSMMALHVGPRRAGKIAGALGYSGSLIDEDNLQNAHKIPVRLIHGEADDVVPVESYTHAKKTLEKLSFPVSGHTTKYLGHGIDNDGIEGGTEFLQLVFS